MRNVVLVGHGQSGKTSLAEAMLYAAKVTERLGSVDAGTTASDADPEEVARQISISLALLPFEWGDHKINLVDTPGYADFAGEVVCGLRVADGVVVVALRRAQDRRLLREEADAALAARPCRTRSARAAARVAGAAAGAGAVAATLAPWCWPVRTP